MCKYQGKATEIMNNQRNITPPKEINKIPMCAPIMEIKTTMRYHLIRKLAIFKKTRNNLLLKMWRNRNTALLVGMHICITSMENSMEVPQKI